MNFIVPHNLQSPASRLTRKAGSGRSTIGITSFASALGMTAFGSERNEKNYVPFKRDLVIITVKKYVISEFYWTILTDQ